MKKIIQPFYVINWDFNSDDIEYFDVMPYFIDEWKEDKKRKHKIWAMHYKDEHKNDGKLIDDTKMPETFDEFKSFILSRSLYNFWARCEYEVIITGWPQQKKERKIDVYEQIKHNIDVVTKIFMDNIL